jgi:hypothetical protein
LLKLINEWEQKKNLSNVSSRYQQILHLKKWNACCRYLVMKNRIKVKTSGSRVIFKNGDKRPIMIHKPHPGNLIKGYAMKQVLNDLMDAGFIK